jgi:deoxyadenosine/deoxycytidine kinase
MTYPRYFPNSTDIWDDTEENGGARGVYVAVSGNTASGKSSLVQSVVALARRRGISLIGVNERELDHPYLHLMFSQPKTFAFPLQVNFMLQRHMVLLRHLGLGHTIMIERSHLDDEMFVCEHLSAGNISIEQYEAYRLLARSLHAKLPLPDIMILLQASVDLSLARIEHSENVGERPEEFPDQSAKERWVRRWHKLYAEFHQALQYRSTTDPLFARTLLLQRDAVTPTEDIATEVVSLIENRLKAGATLP